jgi:hypothetical protein
MQNLELQDRRYLEAAEGWLGLGNFLEANEELECITPQMRAHPDVLCMRWSVYAQEKNGKWRQKWLAEFQLQCLIFRLAGYIGLTACMN